MTSTELLRGVIKKAGSKGITGAQINKAWKSAGRPGDAYNVLGEMARTHKIKRRPIKGMKRGSLYCIA